jgi:hypothetical protein
MQDPAKVASELDAAHATAKESFHRRDFAAYMSLFAPDLRYRQYDGRQNHGQWVIEAVEVSEETIKSRGFSLSLRAPSLV